MSDTDALEPQSFVHFLERLRDILLKHDFMAQATVVAELIDLAHLESSNFAKKLGGGMMWGSSGSVADVAGLGHSLDPVDEETERESFEFRQILVRLADQMRAQGVSSQRSEFVANVLRRGLEMRRSREREP